MNRQRRVWSEQEDNILRYLREERGELKWSVIARKMEEEFNLMGRTGKQCRQRYHNHLNSKLNNGQWSIEQESLLYTLHEELGNKWSSIAHKMPGRSDNAVKNYFYSKLRKSVRRLNKFISDQFNGEYDLISAELLKAILETSEQRFRNSGKTEEQIIDYSNDLKNRLFQYSKQCEEKGEEFQQIAFARTLIEDILFFDKNKKKPNKLLRKRAKSFHNDNYLHPTSHPKLLRTNSEASISSHFTDQLLSIGHSSCSNVDQLPPLKPRKRSLTTRSSKEIRRSSSLSDEGVQNRQTLSNCDKHQKLEFKQAIFQNDEKIKKDQRYNFLSEGFDQECIEAKKLPIMRDFEQDNSLSSEQGHFHIFKTFEDFCHLDGNLTLNFPVQDAKDANHQFVLRVLEPKFGNQQIEGEQQFIIPMDEEN